MTDLVTRYRGRLADEATFATMTLEELVGSDALAAPDRAPRPGPLPARLTPGARPEPGGLRCEVALLREVGREPGRLAVGGDRTVRVAVSARGGGPRTASSR